MNWFTEFLRKLRLFMIGRNGPDTLSNYSIILGFIFSIAASVFKIHAFGIVSWVLLFYSMFRLFSRNVYVRQQENLKFLQMIYKIKKPFIKYKNRYNQKKYYKFYRCSNCKQELRVPKGKGKVRITCPKCKNSFKKMT